MSILDENIEIRFEALLESLGWSKISITDGINHFDSYKYSGRDNEGRYFNIEFFLKGSAFISQDNRVVKIRKDLWRIYYQMSYNNKIQNYPYYSGSIYDIRMERENVIGLMDDIKNRTFNLKNYKIVNS